MPCVEKALAKCKFLKILGWFCFSPVNITVNIGLKTTALQKSVETCFVLPLFAFQMLRIWGARETNIPV